MKNGVPNRNQNRDKKLLFMGWNMAKAGLYVKKEAIQHVM